MFVDRRLDPVAEHIRVPTLEKYVVRGGGVQAFLVGGYCDKG